MRFWYKNDPYNTGDISLISFERAISVRIRSIVDLIHTETVRIRSNADLIHTVTVRIRSAIDLIRTVVNCGSYSCPISLLEIQINVPRAILYRIENLGLSYRKTRFIKFDNPGLSKTPNIN